MKLQLFGRWLSNRRSKGTTKCRGFRTLTGIRAGSVIDSTLNAIPPSLLSYG